MIPLKMERKECLRSRSLSSKLFSINRLCLSVRSVLYPIIERFIYDLVVIFNGNRKIEKHQLIILFGKSNQFLILSMFFCSICFPAMLPEKYRIARFLADSIGGLIQNSGYHHFLVENLNRR
jgi:hypothetical protein